MADRIHSSGKNATSIRHHAYVIMPEHVHLLINPRNEVYQIERILSDIKRPVSWKAKSYLLRSGNVTWLKNLTVIEGSRTVFRFWLPGGGYDKNIFYEKSLWSVIEYIHANPVRRELVSTPSEWEWSSARFWAGDNTVPLRMDHFDG